MKLVDHVIDHMLDHDGVRLHTRSHDHQSRDHGITIAFFFGMSSDKQVIVKNYLQIDKKNLLT